MSTSRDYTIVLPPYFKPTLRHLPEYGIWAAIKNRSTNKNGAKAHRYVKRGITMCHRWKDGEGGKTGFQCFMEDMGPRPSEKHSIDRINNDGNYEPSNCVWATNKQQSNNRSSNHKLEYRGEVMSMMSLSEKTGISYFVLRNRINRGWPVEDAVNKPLGTALFEARTARGTSLPQSRLKEAEVSEIRRLYATKNFTMENLSIRFGVSTGSICHIVNRKTWTHIP